MLRLFYLLLLCWLSFVYFDAPTFPINSITAIVLAIVIVSLIAFAFRKEANESLKGNILRHSTLILIGFVIVHFQFHVDYLFGNIKENNYYVWINHDVVIKALLLSAIGLLSFLLGYLMNRRKSIVKARVSLNNVNTTFLEVAVVGLMLAYFYFINPLYLLGNYGIVDMGEVAVYIAVLFETVLMAIIVQRSINMLKAKSVTTFWEYIKQYNITTWLVIIAYLVSVLLSGDRGPIIFFVIAIFGSYIFVTKRKFKPSIVLFYIFIGAVSITILGRVRTLDTSISFQDRLSLVLESGDENRFGFNSLIPQTQELATSIRCLHYSMDYVPEKEDYMYGRFQVQQLTSIIPFFSNLNEMLYDNNDYKYSGSPNFITWLDQGGFIYSGVGTTVTADFYLDFGFSGVLIGMFMIGLLMRNAELVMFGTTMPSLFAYCFSLTYLCNSVYLSRSTFLIVLKLVCWTYFFIIVNRYLFNNKR